MRAFVAVFPPPEVQVAALTGAIETIRSLAGTRPDDMLRWTRPENVHLTLKFLGEIREEILEDLCAVLEGVCATHVPFDAGLAELGAFPSARRARILWAGIGIGSGRLRSLAVDLDAALAPLGFEREERAYMPHLTLGRVRGRPVSFDLPLAARGDLGFRVRRVELTESTLSAKGAVYRTIRAFTL